MQFYQRPSAFTDRTMQRANGLLPLPLFRLVCLVLLAVFAADSSKCFAGTDDIPERDRIAILDVDSTAENSTNPAFSTAGVMDLPMNLPANLTDGPGSPSIPAFTRLGPTYALDEAFGGIVEGSKRTDRRIPSTRCILFNRSLCGAMKSKPVLALATLQTAALISDGVTTRQYLRRGYVEVDPFAKILIGSKPTWARMAPLGMVQVFAGMWLAQQMATSQHVWVRRFRWLPQVAGIAANAAASAHNVTLR
jgi:hypothetical protein